MKPIQLQLSITVGDESLSTLAEVLAQAIERGMARHTQAVVAKLGELRAERDKPPPPVSAEPAVTAGETSAPEPQQEQGALIDVNEVAKLLNISSRTVYRLNDMGKMPKVIRIGSLVRWSRKAIEQWIADGCRAVERRGLRRT